MCVGAASGFGFLRRDFCGWLAGLLIGGLGLVGCCLSSFVVFASSRSIVRESLSGTDLPCVTFVVVVVVVVYLVIAVVIVAVVVVAVVVAVVVIVESSTLVRSDLCRSDRTAAPTNTHTRPHPYTVPTYLLNTRQGPRQRTGPPRFLHSTTRHPIATKNRLIPYVCRPCSVTSDFVLR